LAGAFIARTIDGRARARGLVRSGPNRAFSSLARVREGGLSGPRGVDVVRVTWRIEPLGSKRMPQNHGRVVDTAKATGTTEGGPSSEASDFLCRHRGDGRSKIRPVVQVCQPKTAERGTWRRSSRLPTFRLCCIDSLPAREADWDAVDSLLEQWFEARSLPKGDSFGVRDLWSVRRAIAKRIPRPASPARRASWLKAQHACVARKRTTQELQRLAEAEASHREEVFATLGLSPTASSWEIKEGLRRKKLEILRNPGSLEELRRVQAAAEAARAHRIAGM
jgi:hypothetical protein